MFRTLMLTCAGLLAAIVAFYGSADADTRADLTLVSGNRINTLDPQQMSWIADIRICINAWEGLTRHDPDTLLPIAGVAQMPPEISADRTRYTFHLRPDARWSNGDPVTAHDFVRGWRRAIEPGTAADYASVLTNHIKGARTYYDWRTRAVQQLARERSPNKSGELEAMLRTHARRMDDEWRKVGIRAEGDHTLEVQLVRPTAYFLELTLLPVLMPIHESIERLREGDPEFGIGAGGLVVYDSQWTKPDYHRNGYPGLVTNGVYRIADWQFRRRLRLKKNPYHPERASAKLETIDVLMFESANTAFQAYETGVVDWLTSLNLDYAGALLQMRHTGERPDVSVVPAFGTYYYNLNCKDAVLPDGRANPFIDSRVRKAFAISIDRDALCAKVAEKENPPTRTLIPPGSIPGYPQVAGHAEDAELANQLLDEAGYEDRALFPNVSLLYNTGQIHGRLAEAVVNMWRETLGVRVGLSGKEAKTFSEDKAKHNYQIARASWYGDYADPTTFLDIFATGNGNNDSGYANPAYDALLADAAACDNADQRMRILAEAETILVTEDFPLIPIYRYTNPQAFRPFVKGIRPNPREIYPLRHVWVER